MLGAFSLWTVTAVASALLMGGLLALLLGSLTDMVRDQLKLTAKGAAALKIAFLVALMLTMVGGGLLADQLGFKTALITGSALAAFSIACLGLTNSQPRALGALALLGAATGLLHTATTAVMPAAFAEFVWGPAPAATNLGYVFVALGSLLIPFLTLYLVKQLGYRNGLLLLALLAVAPGVSAGFAPRLEPTRGIDLAALLADARFWLALVAIFFFYAVETSALRWAPRYIDEVIPTERRRFLLLVVFWVVFVAARLACSAVGYTDAFLWLIFVFSLVSAALIGNLMGMFHSGSATRTFLIIAACLGPIFPTLAGLILVFFPEQPAMALGLLTAVGSLGRLIAGPVTDHYLAQGRIRAAMTLSMALGLIVVFPPLLWVVMPH
jgi:fucose permease